jgi:hypothetical protein
MHANIEVRMRARPCVLSDLHVNVSPELLCRRLPLVNSKVKSRLVLSAVERPHPQLGRDPDVPTWDTRVGHCASDVTLIAVYGGRVDVTIAERVAHQTNISDKNAIGMRSGRSHRIAQ